MGKDVGDYSNKKGAHSNQRNKVHEQHTLEAKKRQFEQLLASYEVLQEFSDYPPFKSKVSDLGPGNNWILLDDKMKEVDGEDWLMEMYHLAAENEHFHVRNQSNTKVYYRQRKIRDRDKLSPHDKTHRPKTDLRRFTIDLRPDQSRAIQKMLSAGKTAEARELVDKIRDECIRLFQTIYHRDVRAVSEHTDSGQLHFDLWHSGIRDVEVHDSCADVIDGKLVNGFRRLIRERTEYRAFGVGVGVASWHRHRKAIEDAGKKPSDIVNKETLDTITKMAKLKKKETQEIPRDMRYYEALDKYAAIEISYSARDLADDALSEYIDWLSVGYKAGKLGKQAITEREKRMATKIKQLRHDNENLRQEIQNTDYEKRRLSDSFNFVLGFLKRLANAKDLMAELVKAGLKQGFDKCMDMFTLKIDSKPLEEQLVPAKVGTEKINPEKQQSPEDQKKQAEDLTPDLN
jgi:hypothetical protein